MCRCIDVQMYGWMAGWMDGWLDAWMAGWLAGWMDGWMKLYATVCNRMQLYVAVYGCNYLTIYLSIYLSIYIMYVMQCNVCMFFLSLYPSQSASSPPRHGFADPGRGGGRCQRCQGDAGLGRVLGTPTRQVDRPFEVLHMGK